MEKKKARRSAFKKKKKLIRRKEEKQERKKRRDVRENRQAYCQEDRGITLLFVNCALGRHFVMTLLEASAKNSHFSLSERPSSSRLRASQLGLQRLSVWHASRRLSDSPAICSLEASVPPPPLIVDVEYGTARKEETWKPVCCPLTTFSTLTFHYFPCWLGSALWIKVYVFVCVCVCMCVKAQVCNCLVCIECGTWALFPDMLIAGFHLLQMWFGLCFLCTLSLALSHYVFRSWTVAADDRYPFLYLNQTIFTAVNYTYLMFPAGL